MLQPRDKPRPGHRVIVENEMIKRREKEMRHQLQWNGQVKYYKTFEKSNNKFESWTSPRYYESNNQQWQEIRKKQTKEELLEKRREKLKQLFLEEEKSQGIELMVKNRNKFLLTPRTEAEETPIEVLKEVNSGIKLKEEDRKRHEAELNLYQQWRNNNPVLRHYERMRGLRDTKLSWLDQQIKKRMDQEKNEEECRKMLQERDKRLKEEKLREEQFKTQIKQKNQELKLELEKQVDELENKKREAELLRLEEDKELATRIKFLELEETHKQREKELKEKELALFNVKQHKQKLRNKANEVKERLLYEKLLIEQILKEKIVEQVQNENKRKELRLTLTQFLEFAKEQERLEKQRITYFDSLFDSEAKAVYEKQEEMWEKEKRSRKELLENVMASIKEQIEDGVANNQLRQKMLLEEREQVLKKVEEFNEEMEKLKQEELRKKIEFREQIDEQIRERTRRKRELELLEQSKIDRDLENVRKEEARLKNEILKLQMQGPNHRRRSGKTRIF